MPSQLCQIRDCELSDLEHIKMIFWYILHRPRLYWEIPACWGQCLRHSRHWVCRRDSLVVHSERLMPKWMSAADGEKKCMRHGEAWNKNSVGQKTLKTLRGAYLSGRSDKNSHLLAVLWWAGHCRGPLTWVCSFHSKLQGEVLSRSPYSKQYFMGYLEIQMVLKCRL